MTLRELTLIGGVNKLSYGRVTINLLIQLQKLGVKVNLIPIGGPEAIECEGKEKGAIDWGLENCKTLTTNAPIVKCWHANDMRIPEILDGPLYGFTIFELDTFTPQEKEQLSQVKIINCTKWATQICHQNGLTNTVGVVNLGVDLDIFKPIEREKNSLFNVLNVSKIEIRKGHDIIPDIFSLAFKKEDKVMLTMCWDNPFYSQGEKDSWVRFYEKKLDGFCFSFIPRLNSQYEVSSLMNRADIGLFPSRAEGWGLDILEMMACGKPVIGTNYSGHTEFIDTTYSVTPTELELAIDSKWFFAQGRWAKISDKNVEEFSTLLRRYYEEWIRTYNAPIKNNNRTIAESFTWENSAKQLLEILNVNS